MKLTTFLALGAIVGVDLNSPTDPKERTKAQRRQRQKQDDLCIKRGVEFPQKGGRLGQIAGHLVKLCKGFIDKPNYQCRCLKRQKKIFWSMTKARKVCLDRKKDFEAKMKRKENQSERKQRQRDNKEAQKARKQAKQERQRRSLDDGDENEDEILNEEEEILNEETLREIEIDTQRAIDIEEGAITITTTDMEDLVNQQCSADSVDEDDAEECDMLRKATSDLQANEEDEEAKERSEVIFRIIKMHRAYDNWARTYISDVDCDKRKKMMTRAKKNRQRMQKKRLLYPTNPQKTKRLKAEARKQEEEKVARKAPRAADKEARELKKANKNQE